jgi:hypothetical protein
VIKARNAPNIFGGYTEQSWSQNGSYTSQDAWLFSLVNKHGERQRRGCAVVAMIAVSCIRLRCPAVEPSCTTCTWVSAPFRQGLQVHAEQHQPRLLRFRVRACVILPCTKPRLRCACDGPAFRLAALLCPLAERTELKLPAFS